MRRPSITMSFAKCVIPGACPGTDAVAPDDCLFDNTSVVIGCAKGRNTSCSAKDNILCAACAKGYVPFGDHGECVACKLGNSYTMVSVYGLVPNARWWRGTGTGTGTGASAKGKGKGTYI